MWLCVQLQTGLVLGSLDLPLINTCLEKIKAEQPMTPAMTDECKHAIAKLGEQVRYMDSLLTAPCNPATARRPAVSRRPESTRC